MEKPEDEKESPAPILNQTKESEPALEWTCHPVKRKPLLSALVTVFIFMVVLVVYYSTESKAFGVLAAVVMIASLAKFYFPTTYRLTHEKIIIKTTTQTLRKDWSIYRSCYPDKHGILLSPFVRPSRLENFRGVYLMFSNNHDEVTSFVKTHIDKRADSESQDEGGEA